uniref:J domain-containing protein n=1 Tax=Tanacetum cinerariifolium TaxID=118510 RepID=A0A699JPH8_TANCI|nr:hypothetical protein [Tanacetum cinerariifolium]
MALKYHPDVCPPDCAHECNMRFIQVKEAYETLISSYVRYLCYKGLPLGQTSLSEKGQWKATWETQLLKGKREALIPLPINRGEGASWRSKCLLKGRGMTSTLRNRPKLGLKA